MYPSLSFPPVRKFGYDTLCFAKVNYYMEKCNGSDRSIPSIFHYKI